jgi:hypothetical protein
MALAGASRRTLPSCGTIIIATKVGAMTQLNTPPTSQYVSHDQRRTPL